MTVLCGDYASPDLLLMRATYWSWPRNKRNRICNNAAGFIYGFWQQMARTVYLEYKDFLFSGFNDLSVSYPEPACWKVDMTAISENKMTNVSDKPK